MEHLAAALTGAFLTLFCWDLAWGTQSLVAKQGGARLLKVFRLDAFPPGSKPGTLRSCVRILSLSCVLLICYWFVVPTPFITFAMTSGIVAAIGLDRRPRRYLQLLEHGMVLTLRGRVAFVPYHYVRDCQWEDSCGRLMIQMKRSWEECDIRARDVEAVTRVLASHVELRDESGAIISAPAASGTGSPPVPDVGEPRRPAAPVFARFQFTLRTLLLAALVVSAASGWLAIYQRHIRQQRAALAQLDPFKPSAFWINGYVYDLGFSGTPGDDDLEPLEKLTGLHLLQLNGSNVTDDGLVHLRNLRSLEQLSLSGTRITDAGLVHLHDLTNLRWVNLQGTRVTDQGVAQLHEALPKAEIFR